MRVSTDAINRDFNTEWYKDWADHLGLRNTIHHGKFWEQAMLYEALKKFDMLRPGRHGLGFGVGREQLVSVFANEGASITATDQPPERDTAFTWDNGQLADGKDSLFYEDLIDRETFDRNVKFEPHDMNTFKPSYINRFDFTWSDCVIGHVGSMELSEKHLIRHSKYIRYGGISVLTTELNISSLTETVSDNSGTIIWRLSDLYRVFNDMLDHDMVAIPFKLRLAKDSSDYHIYYDIDYLAQETLLSGRYEGDAYATKIPFSNYAIVQIQILFIKKHLSPAKKLFYRQLYRKDHLANRRKLRKFIKSHGDITDYSTRYTSTDLDITPKQSTKALKLKPGETKQIKVTFTNNSQKPVFMYGLHTPLHVPPLVLATINPVNRDSTLYAKTWFSKNRPAVEFTPTYNERDFVNSCHGYHRALPGDDFTYTFKITAPKKKGTYKEDFGLILEGVGDVPKSTFTLKLTVG